MIDQSRLSVTIITDFYGTPVMAKPYEPTLLNVQTDYLSLQCLHLGYQAFLRILPDNFIRASVLDYDAYTSGFRFTPANCSLLCSILPKHCVEISIKLLLLFETMLLLIRMPFVRNLSANCSMTLMRTVPCRPARIWQLLWLSSSGRVPYLRGFFPAFGRCFWPLFLREVF